MSSQPPAQSADRPRGARLVRRGIAVVCLALAALAVLWVGVAVRPPEPLGRASQTIEIPASLGVLGIAGQLAEQGVIRSQAAFVGLTLLRGTVRSLKAGEYEVPQGASLLTVARLLETGRVKPHLLVLPEGFTIRDLARQVEAEGIALAAEVVRSARQSVLRLEPRDRSRFARGVPVPRHLPGHQGHARGGDPRADGPTLPRPGGYGRGGRARPTARHEPPPARHARLDRGAGNGAGGGTAHHRSGLPQQAPARHAAPGRSDRVLRPGQGGAGALPG